MGSGEIGRAIHQHVNKPIELLFRQGRNMTQIAVSHLPGTSALL
jgi:hypothetical protein